MAGISTKFRFTDERNASYYNMRWRAFIHLRKGFKGILISILYFTIGIIFCHIKYSGITGRRKNLAQNVDALSLIHNFVRYEAVHFLLSFSQVFKFTDVRIVFSLLSFSIENMVYFAKIRLKCEEKNVNFQWSDIRFQ